MSDEELVYAPQLAAALVTLKSSKGKDYVEILSQVEGPDQVKLRLRIFDLETWTHQLLPIVLKEELRMNAQEDEGGWNLHICRQYMFDSVSGKLKFFWNFIVSSTDIKQAVRDLCRLVDMYTIQMKEMPAPPLLVVPTSSQRSKRGPSVPLEEKDLFSNREAGGVVLEDGLVVSIPLLGGANRNVPEGSFFEKGKGQKGAHIIGGSQ